MQKFPFSALATTVRCSWGTSIPLRVAQRKQRGSIASDGHKSSETGTTPDPYKLPVVKASTDLFYWLQDHSEQCFCFDQLRIKNGTVLYPCVIVLRLQGDGICPTMSEYCWPPAASVYAQSHQYCVFSRAGWCSYSKGQLKWNNRQPS